MKPEHRVIRRISDNAIIHVHTITEDGKYLYSLEQDLERFGYDKNLFTISNVFLYTPEMEQQIKIKIKKEEDEKKVIQVKKQEKILDLKNKLNLTDEQLKLLRLTI